MSRAGANVALNRKTDKIGQKLKNSRKPLGFVISFVDKFHQWGKLSNGHSTRCVGKRKKGKHAAGEHAHGGEGGSEEGSGHSTRHRTYEDDSKAARGKCGPFETAASQGKTNDKKTEKKNP